MTETAHVDDGPEPTPESASRPATENRLRAEQELRERLQHERRRGQAEAAERTAALLAKIKMGVSGHP